MSTEQFEYIKQKLETTIARLEADEKMSAEKGDYSRAFQSKSMREGVSYAWGIVCLSQKV